MDNSKHIKNENKILTNSYNFSSFVKNLYMHETLEYYRYINLRILEPDTLVNFYFILSTIYLKLYIIFLKYIFTYLRQHPLMKINN